MDDSQCNEVVMTAPRLKELTDHHSNGYTQEGLWNPEDLELFNRIEAEFSRLPFCMDGFVHVLWVSVPRGSEEDYLSLWGDDDEYTREEILEQFYHDHPDEEDWYRLVHYHTERGNRGMSFDGLELCATPDIRFHRASGRRTEFLRWALDVTRRTIDSVEAGTYRDHVLRDLPLAYRRGVVRRSDLWDRGYRSREDVLQGLTDGEVERFRGIVSEGLEEGPSKTVPSMTLSDFLDAASLCFSAQGRDIDGMTKHEQYMRYSDGRYGRLLDLDPDDPEAFHRFVFQNDEGHAWEVLPGSCFTRMHLYPHYDDTGCHLYLCGFIRRSEFVRSALALHDAGFPLCVDSASKVSASFDGTDWVGIVPRGGAVAYESHHYKEHDVLDCIAYTDELIEKVGDLIEWYDVDTYYPIDPSGESTDRKGNRYDRLSSR